MEPEGASQLEVGGEPVRGGKWVCQRCTACCRWPGHVRVTEEEIGLMAGHLGIAEHDFIQRYTRLRFDRKGLVLEEQEGGACIFLDGMDCLVQGVKPKQCRDFPNGWNFPGWQDICHAVFVVG
jgi:Fe-S-cluster containining protein